MSKDIHNEPFDDGTNAKLYIFRDYLREWLPVFISARTIYWSTINIFDFFAGPGKDLNGVFGTPLIILEELKPYKDQIEAKKLTINLYFNEYDRDKYEILKDTLDKESSGLPYNIQIESKDFSESFESKYSSLNSNGTANLLFLDQNGIKQINESVFKRIINLKRTDFLFFISSSTIKRFTDHHSIKAYFHLDKEEIDSTPYHQIHRKILDYYKELIPRGKEYYLAPFSLKKKSGLYGLIFGSGNVLGIEKFLNTSWKSDPERGEANFDIDNDKIIPGQIQLFTGQVAKPKKLEIFNDEFEEKILNGDLLTDKDIYLFTITNGFRAAHARAVLKKLELSGKLEKMSLNLSNKVCKQNADITTIKLK